MSYAIGLESKNFRNNRETSKIDLIQFDDSGKWKTIRTLVNNSENQLSSIYTDFILEKPGQMGFVENTTNYRSYNICKFSDTGDFIFTINTKGYFYGVSRNYNSNYYCEYFIDEDNYYCVSRSRSSSAISASSSTIRMRGNCSFNVMSRYSREGQAALPYLSLRARCLPRHPSATPKPG